MIQYGCELTILWHMTLKTVYTHKLESWGHVTGYSNEIPVTKCMITSTLSASNVLSSQQIESLWDRYMGLVLFKHKSSPTNNQPYFILFYYILVNFILLITLNGDIITSTYIKLIFDKMHVW